MTAPTTVHCADAIAWLEANELPKHAGIVTSLPDAVEFRHRDVDRWRPWFRDAARLVVARTPQSGAAVFYQTDVKRDGRWIDKATLVHEAAAAAGAHLVWHKIVCRAPAGTATHGRPGYAHLLCFARERLDDADRASPDVLPQHGAMLWPRGMGLDAARFAVGWLHEIAGVDTIVAPFCGLGTALIAARERRLAGIGIEQNARRAERARAAVAEHP